MSECGTLKDGEAEERRGSARMRHDEPKPGRGKVKDPGSGGDLLVSSITARSCCGQDWRTEAEERRRRG